jgi:hypothetical protein
MTSLLARIVHDFTPFMFRALAGFILSLPLVTVPLE